MSDRAYFSWSSGKDASLALYWLKQKKHLNIDKLITTINSYYGRVSMHGLRTELLEKQTQSIGISLDTIALPQQPTMEEYELAMKGKLELLQSEGYTRCGFGDIFLEDLREYREKQLKPFNIQAVFPLWKKDTKQLLEEFINLGFKAVVICLKSDALDASFLGREIDRDFISDLPKNVDPCGENGEFHTFCFDGPIFSEPIAFTLGESVFREYKNPDRDVDNSQMGFWFCDLLPIT